jgi:glyoxylase-like metal-dependent hydrolase (beta-lactamase superfamily II)
MRTSIIIAVASLVACGEPRSVPARVAPRIEQVASPAEGIFANAYLVETPGGVVLIDTTLRVSDATALRARIGALGKPLLGVLLSHGHPDHYNGTAIVTAGRDVPVIATREVDRVIRSDDAMKEQLWKPMFGAEWPAPRAFPNRPVGDDDVVRLGGLDFRVHAIGPAESHPGHGKVGGTELLAAERRYLVRLRGEVRRLSPGGGPLTDTAKAELQAALNQLERDPAVRWLRDRLRAAAATLP